MDDIKNKFEYEDAFKAQGLIEVDTFHIDEFGGSIESASEAARLLGRTRYKVFEVTFAQPAIVSLWANPEDQK